MAENVSDDRRRWVSHHLRCRCHGGDCHLCRRRRNCRAKKGSRCRCWAATIFAILLARASVLFLRQRRWCLLHKHYFNKDDARSDFDCVDSVAVPPSCPLPQLHQSNSSSLETLVNAHYDEMVATSSLMSKEFYSLQLPRREAPKGW